MPTNSTELWPVPVQLVSKVVGELAQHGISIERQLKDTGVSEQDLRRQEKLLPYRTAQKILTRACELSPTPQLGITVGSKQSTFGIGLLGYSINCCATIEDAMNMATKYSRVSSTLTQFEWKQEGGKLYWEVTPPVDLGKILRCVVEEELSMVVGAYLRLTGLQPELLEAHFQYPKPEYHALYKSTFNCPLFFSAERNQLVLSAEALKQPILQANPFGVAAAERMCVEFLEKNPATDDLIMRVRAVILQQNNKQWSETSISDKLNVTPRTLRNRLRRAGTSYQQILDSLREQISRDDLLRSTLTVSEIAENIGYSDARSFRRAFKKWTGETPDQYRIRCLQ